MKQVEIYLSWSAKRRFPEENKTKEYIQSDINEALKEAGIDETAHHEIFGDHIVYVSDEIKALKLVAAINEKRGYCAKFYDNKPIEPD